MTGNFTHSIKGKSVILSRNKCYRLQPLMTALTLMADGIQVAHPIRLPHLHSRILVINLIKGDVL